MCRDLVVVAVCEGSSPSSSPRSRLALHLADCSARILQFCYHTAVFSICRERATFPTKITAAFRLTKSPSPIPSDKRQTLTWYENCLIIFPTPNLFVLELDRGQTRDNMDGPWPSHIPTLHERGRKHTYNPLSQAWAGGKRKMCAVISL